MQNKGLISAGIAVAVVVIAIIIFSQTGDRKEDQQAVNNETSQKAATKEDVMMKDDAMSDDKALGVVMKSGQLYSVWHGNEIMKLDHDLTLKNGNKVTADGKIMTSNGTVITLKEGEQLNADGSRTMVNLSDMMELKMEGEMKKDDAMMKKDDDAMMKKDDGAMMQKEGDAMQKTQPGAYKDYTSTTVAAEAKAGNKVVLFFHAAWCPFCKAADQAFTTRTSEIPAGVVVLKTNYDLNDELKKKYVVTYQHTFVQVDASGNQITKWSGGDIDNLKKYVK